MRFLLDQSTDARLIPFLAELGHAATRIGADYAGGIPDVQVLAIASDEGRILITDDRDFGELVIRSGLPHAGVIYLRLGSYAELFHVIADRDRPIPFAPELAVEVASPAQDEDALAAKARLYLRGGTRLVWIVWPHGQTVDVWRAGATAGPVRTLGAGDLLDGEDVVPGFSHPVAGLFA
jgi:predicted nuclease of predicted toxin-antitoxin system